MRAGFLGLLAVGLSTSGAVIVACGTSRSGFAGGEDAGPTTTGDAGETSVDSGGFDPGDAYVPACGTRCSSDLHSLVDCNGTVVKTCPDDQGCTSSGECVPACDSAAANKSSLGCDFFAVEPDNDYGGRCYAAYIANSWNAPVTLTVDRGGTMYPVATIAKIPSGSGTSLTYGALPGGLLDVGQVAIVFLAGTGCPGGVNVAMPGDAARHGTGKTLAFHITASAPVAAYDIYPYGGGSSAIASATLLLPTPVWDVNYVAASAYPHSPISSGKPTLHVIASQDGTNVTINPVANIVAGSGVAGTTAGTPQTYALNKGEVVVFSQNDELTGSPIESDKPVAVVGGHTCLNIPLSTPYCDASHQQLPPVKSFGHEYVAVRHRNRLDSMDETPPWRLVGAVDGTTLTYEPSTPPGAPTTLSSGQLAEFATGTPFVVKSQDDSHPFYMAGYMSGCGTIGDIDMGPVGCPGDPEFVNVIPPAEYLSEYTFFTDPTYPESNLVVVRNKGPKGFEDVELDCGGKLTGWQAIGSSGDYEYTRFDLVRHNFQPQGSCDNGRHQIHSKMPFGVTVWGWGTSATGQNPYSQAVSYAYPAGASVTPINVVVVPTEPK